MNDFNFEMPDFGMPDFDISGFDDESGKITRAENRYCLPSTRRDVKSHMVKYDRAEDFAKDKTLPMSICMAALKATEVTG